MNADQSVRVLRCLGVRGAISVDENTAEAILDATHELLAAIAGLNQIDPVDIGAIWFTTTSDLNAEYPAVAARKLMGWTEVAMMCGQEMDVPHSLKHCLRVLVMWNTTLTPHEIQHVYLRDAQQLRPDRVLPVLNGQD